MRGFYFFLFARVLLFLRVEGEGHNLQVCEYGCGRHDISTYSPMECWSCYTVKTEQEVNVLARCRTTFLLEKNCQDHLLQQQYHWHAPTCFICGWLSKHGECPPYIYYINALE